MRQLSLLVLVLSVACTTGNEAYHLSQPKGAPASPVEYLTSDEKNVLAYLESDDMGELFSDEQLHDVVREIERLSGGDGALVITYVHGWRHNAKLTDDNLQRFRNEILRRAIANEAVEARSAGLPPRPVIGIFVAWRGELFGSVAVKAKLGSLSYYNRTEAATRVGGATASEVLSAITRAAKHFNERSRSVIIGHSLGGLITERGLIPPIQEFLEQAAVANEKTMTRRSEQFPADLVILINPASRALEAEKFITMLSRWSVKVHGWSPFASSSDATRPLLVSITSKEDSATGIIFHTANVLDAPDKAFRPTGGDPKYSAFGSQYDLFVHNAGHWPALYTHDLFYSPGIHPFDSTDKVATCGNPHSGDQCVRVGSDEFDFMVGPRSNTTPYWVMSVDPRVVPNHSDVFTPQFYRMMKALLALTGGFHRDNERVVNSRVWGLPLGDEQIEAQIPAPCALPRHAYIDFEGATPGCTASSPSTCRAGERMHLKLRDETTRAVYAPKQCDDIVWSGPGHPLTDAPPSQSVEMDFDFAGFSSLTSVSARIGNHLGFTIATIPELPVIQEVPVTLTYSCASLRDGSCAANDLITITASVAQRASGDSFDWLVKGESVADQHGPSISRSFRDEGSVDVRVRYNGLNRNGNALTSISIRIDCDRLQEKASFYVDHPGESCILGEVVAFRTNYGSDPPCRSFAWTIDRVPVPSDDVLYASLKPGPHDIAVTVSSDGKRSSASTTVNVCPPLDPRIDYSGPKSGCKRDVPCWNDEEIVFSVVPTSCGPVEWIFEDKVRLAKNEPVPWRFSTPSDRIVHAKITCGGKTFMDEAIVRVVPVPPVCKPPDDVAIAYSCPPATKDGACTMDVPVNFSFSESGYQPSSECDTIRWLDDTGDAGTSATFERTFAECGTYVVHAVVTRGAEVRTASVTVRVGKTQPKDDCSPGPRRHKRLCKASLEPLSGGASISGGGR